MSHRTCPLDHPDRRPVTLGTDQQVCSDCLSTLRDDLAGLADLVGDLHVVRAAAQPDAPVAADAPPTPADDAAWVLRETLLYWLGWLVEARGDRVPGSWAEVGTHLADTLDWVARHPDGADCVDELTAALRQARAAVSRPSPAAPGPRPTGPGPRLDPADRAAQALLTIGGLSRAAEHLGVRVSRRTIDSWARHGRLVARGQTTLRDGRSARTYRVGDVLALARAAAQAARTPRTTSTGRTATAPTGCRRPAPARP